MELSQIASSVYNDVVSGLAGMNANPTISLEQLEDECVSKRQVVIREMYTKGLIKKDDLMVAINCIPVDCKDPTKCTDCNKLDNHSSKLVHHFEIPQLMEGLGHDALIFVGSADRNTSYDVYYEKGVTNAHQYRRRGANKPYVYIERTPNQNNMYDGWIYNLPFVKRISVIGIFKDLRQIGELNCDCSIPNFLDFGIVSDEVRTRLTKEKLQYYRQYLAQPQPNNLTPR